MPKNTILFDLGNTLVSYWQRSEWPEMLQHAIVAVRRTLADLDLLRLDPQRIWERVQNNGVERKDCRVCPLEERLTLVFDIEDRLHDLDLMRQLCSAFMRPLFARGHLYDDTLATLGELREAGYRTAIVSNTPWGSPADLWRAEVRRHGLEALVNEVVFCRDVGWRKPDRRIFEHTMSRLGVKADQCVFVGDDPRWDIAGPAAIGMDAVLIDRSGADAGAIRELAEITRRLA